MKGAPLQTQEAAEAGRDEDQESALGPHISFDRDADVLTVNGYKIAIALLTALTASPCGVNFRIIERKDGVITVTQDRDPVAVAARDMLALLDRCEWFLRDMPALSRNGSELLADICVLKAKATGGT